MEILVQDSRGKILWFQQKLVSKGFWGRQIQLLCQIYRIQNGGSNMANKISKKIRIAFLNFNVRRWISYFEFQKSDFTFHI